MDVRLCYEKGRLEVFKWAKMNACISREITCTSAIGRRHLEVLKMTKANECHWDMLSSL